MDNHEGRAKVPSSSLNPRRRPYSQPGAEEDLSERIVDLYSTESRRSIDCTLPASHRQSSQHIALTLPDDGILHSSRTEDIPGFSHASHPAGIVDKATAATSAKRPIPASWDEEDDSCFSRYWRNITIFSGIGTVLLFIIIILAWPRGVLVAIKQIKPAGSEEHKIFMMNDKLGVMVDNIMEMVVENYNFLPVRIRNASVEGFWLLPQRRPLGNGTLEKVSIGPKQSKTIDLPYKMEHLADPHNDSIYQDFFARCARPEPDRQDIDMEYLVTIDLSYLGVKFHRQLNYSYRVPCPVGLSPVNIGKILETSGYDPAKIIVTKLDSKPLDSIINPNVDRKDADHGQDRKGRDQGKDQ